MPKEYETSEQREKRELDEELDRQLRESGQRSPKDHAACQTSCTKILCARHWAKPPLINSEGHGAAIRGHANAAERLACAAGDCTPKP